MMALEKEAKIKVDDLEPVRKKLAQLNAHRASAELETNFFFDRADGMLRHADKGLRIRRAKEKSGKERCTVTMKGPLLPGKLKSRDEIQFTVDDPKAVRHLFENLGFALTLSFQKRRETWKLRDCEVALDELPHLGQFVEIEGKSTRRILSVRRALGLSNRPLISTGYISMLARYLKQHGLKDRHIRF
jgi:adenylate cyclase class 2